MIAHHKDWHGTPAKGKSRSEMIKYLPLPDKPKESRLRRLPHEEEKLEALIEAFILWAHSDDAWDIDEFPVQYGNCPYYFRHHKALNSGTNALIWLKPLLLFALKKCETLISTSISLKCYLFLIIIMLNTRKACVKTKNLFLTVKLEVLIVEADHIPDSALVKDFIPKDKENDGD